MLKNSIIYYLFNIYYYLNYYRCWNLLDWYYWWLQSSKEHFNNENILYIFFYWKFCNNAKLFTVTFDQFNVSLLNKGIK